MVVTKMLLESGSTFCDPKGKQPNRTGLLISHQTAPTMAQTHAPNPHAMTGVLRLLLALAAISSMATGFAQNIYIYRPNKVGGAALNVKVSINGLDHFALYEKNGLKLEEYGKPTIELYTSVEVFSGVNEWTSTDTFEVPEGSDVYIEVLPTLSSVSVRAVANASVNRLEFSTWKYPEFEQHFRPRIVNQVAKNTEEPTATSAQGSEPNPDRVRVRVAENMPAIGTIAVVGKPSEMCDGSLNDGRELAEFTAAELIGVYTVVGNRHLTASAPQVDDAWVIEEGCMSGAQAVVIASYGCLQNQTRIQLKLVDCTTAENYWSATGIGASELELLDAVIDSLRNP